MRSGCDRMTCSVSICEKAPHAKGMCGDHYQASKRPQGSLLWMSAHGEVPVFPRPASLPGETWRPVVGWEGLYEVSDLGRVLALQKVIKMSDTSSRLGKPLILSQGVRKHGYRSVALNHKESGRYNRTNMVHALVAQAFLGDRPEGMEVAHGNGDPSDNRLVNLRYATPTENNRDKIQHGTLLTGERHQNHIITADTVREIRQAHQLGASQADIAREYGADSVAHLQDRHPSNLGGLK